MRRMKKFSCGDVVPGCSAKFERTNEAEIMQAVAEHARTDHGLTSIEPDLEAAVRAKILDAPDHG